MPTYAEEIISPSVAQLYLGMNTHNRPVKTKRIEGYAIEMASGRWRANGEAIKFSSSNKLLDGQNRLHAIIKANVSVTILVVRGLDDTDQETMDIGANRSLSDVLALRGELSTHALAATIRSLWLWDDAINSGRKFVGSTTRNIPGMTHSALLEYFGANAEQCRELVAKSRSVRDAFPVPASLLAPLIREMDKVDAGDSTDFFDRIKKMIPSPHNYGENDPLVQLQKAIVRIRSNSKVTYNNTEIAALIVKAWNAYRDGVPISQLQWRSGGKSPEAFPEIR